MEIVNRIKRNFEGNYYVGENNYGKENFSSSGRTE